VRIDAARPMAAWVAVLATPDGPLLAPHGDGGTRLFDARTKAPRGTWPAVARASVSLAGGRTLLLAAGLDGPRRFDLTAGAELPPVADPAEVWDVAVAALPDGRVLLAGAGPGGLHRWDAATGARIGATPIIGPNLRAITAVQRPGGVTLIATDDSMLYRWDAATGGQLRPPQQTDATALAGLTVAPSTREMLIGCDWGGAVYRWDPHTGVPLGDPVPLPSPVRLAGCFRGPLERPCALLLAADGPFDAAVGVDLERGERIPLPAAARAVFTLDGRTLVALVHTGGQLTVEPLYA
jgi:WD40 repeat protein